MLRPPLPTEYEAVWVLFGSYGKKFIFFLVWKRTVTAWFSSPQPSHQPTTISRLFKGAENLIIRRMVSQKWYFARKVRGLHPSKSLPHSTLKLPHNCPLSATRLCADSQRGGCATSFSIRPSDTRPIGNARAVCAVSSHTTSSSDMMPCLP